MKEKIAQAKELYMFLVDWGMSEGDAKKTALAVVFGIKCSPPPGELIEKMKKYLDGVADKMATHGVRSTPG